jgi:hypothetical protein
MKKHGAGQCIKKRMRKIMKASNQARIEYYTSRELKVPRGGQPTKDTSNGYVADRDESGEASDEGTN